MAKTRGNITIEDIKIGDVHYEYFNGRGIKVTVTSLPIRNEEGYWSWQSVTEAGKTVDYGVTEGLEHYGPTLYDYEAYLLKKVMR